MFSIEAMTCWIGQNSSGDETGRLCGNRKDAYAPVQICKIVAVNVEMQLV